jgi:uncharacterized protein YecE (DUF72 family)
MGDVYIGTSGYSYIHWRELFYPKGLAQAKWLSFYAEHYDSVEINATFYRTFDREVYKKWHDLTPAEFKFSLKGPNSITRFKRLRDVDEELALFFDANSELGDKLAVTLWQMPPSFHLTHETLGDVENFFERLPRRCRHVIEIRHRSWADERFFALLNTYRVGWVTADSSRFLSETHLLGGVGYLRLHGPDALYASSYTDVQLEKWAVLITEMRQKGNVCCYFNNDFGGHAVANSQTLQKLLAINVAATAA